ncbi:unnamed protein product, partial [Owenia fusiformis]
IYANYAKGKEWYRKQMPYSYPGQTTIEKSPAYFRTDWVAERIHRFNSSIKLLVIIRDPVTWLISDYTQVYTNRKEQDLMNKRFENMVIDPVTLKVNTNYMAVKISVYERYFDHYLKVFNRSQIHIVDGEKLITNPAMEMVKVEQFLGLEPFITTDTFYFNKTLGFFCKKDGTNECLYKKKGRKHPQIDPFVKYKLKKFFKPHNEKLFHMINQTFDWD